MHFFQESIFKKLKRANIQIHLLTGFLERIGMFLHTLAQNTQAFNFCTVAKCAIVFALHKLLHILKQIVKECQAG
jgi:hypothetical protein